jgi:hypothetical protein
VSLWSALIGTFAADGFAHAGPASRSRQTQNDVSRGRKSTWRERTGLTRLGLCQLAAVRARRLRRKSPAQTTNFWHKHSQRDLTRRPCPIPPGLSAAERVGVAKSASSRHSLGRIFHGDRPDRNSGYVDGMEIAELRFGLTDWARVERDRKDGRIRSSVLADPAVWGSSSAHGGVHTGLRVGSLVH